jgi:predicted PurR-regulated permease PerM
MASSIEKVLTFSIFIILLIVSFFIFRPYFASLMAAIVLAYIFYPVYILVNKIIKHDNISAFLVCFAVVVIFVVSFWIIFQIAINQIVDFYAYTQSFDITAPIKAIVSKISNVQEFPLQLSFFIDKTIETIASNAVNASNSILMNLPVIVLQAFVAFFAMFYFIRDGKEIIEYLKGVMPFKESFKEKFFTRYQEITNGVIYGMVIVGIIQGLTAGIGYYIFGVKGAFVLMIASMFISIFPFIGPWLVYIPTGLIMMSHGNTNGLGLIVYGAIIASQIDNVIRPYFIGKKAKISMVLALIGMLGGFELFGIVGLIIGPLIVDYTVMFVELYKSGKISELV